MIAGLNGKILYIKNDYVVINVNGVCYQIFCTSTDLDKLSDLKGSDVFIFTELIVREDSLTLYGFLEEKSKSGFNKLLKINGIGAKAALAMLSFYDIDKLSNIIFNEDISQLKKIPGIGEKTAKRIIFDLKGVILNESPEIENSNEYQDDLIAALVKLGYKPQIVNEKIKKIDMTEDFQKDFKQLLKELAK